MCHGDMVAEPSEGCLKIHEETASSFPYMKILHRHNFRHPYPEDCSENLKKIMSVTHQTLTVDLLLNHCK